MKVGFRKINFLTSMVARLLQSTELSYEERKNLKKAKDYLQDVALSSTTEINHANEIYSEMSKHKTYAENADKSLELLEKKQKDVAGAVAKEYEFSFEPFELTTKFTGDDKTDFYSVAVELEDYILKITDKTKK